jgi:hypothetical protein
MYASHDDLPFLDRAGELLVIAAWLAVPLFALLAGGALAPPLHAAGIATLLTLLLRAWRSTRRGQALDEIQQRLAAYLNPPAPWPVRVHNQHDHAPHFAACNCLPDPARRATPSAGTASPRLPTPLRDRPGRLTFTPHRNRRQRAPTL